MVSRRKPAEVTLDLRGVKPARKKKPEAPHAEVKDELGLIQWRAFWEAEHVEEDWLVEPILPRAREIAMYCVAGIGKSEIALYVAAAAATGQKTLDRPEGAPLNTVYLDYEMTVNDLKSRLLTMGYGPESNLRHLFYYLLPSLPPLDTRQGGEAVLKLCEKHKAELLVIDTTSRVVTGDESSSDTYRDFHEHSGRKLKEQGVTIWRLDHAGKSIAAGQRGSSAKNDDVDIIWFLQRTKRGIHLIGEKRRQSWVPEEINLTRQLDPLKYVFEKDHVAQGTLILIDSMNKLKLPLDLTVREARVALRKAKISARQEYLTDALRIRKTSGNGHFD